MISVDVYKSLSRFSFSLLLSGGQCEYPGSAFRQLVFLDDVAFLPGGMKQKGKSVGTVG